ncbi:MAG: hypothetical protein IPK97_05830 [Ahniella sp.]|nr:hypothetical protein [Ahniella sp.]
MLARMLRAFIQLTDTMADRDPDLSPVWAELGAIAEASRELGQFPFEGLAKMVRGLSDQVDTPEFDTLYSLIVDIQRQRVSDGEAGDGFRSRGVQKLLNGKPYDAIRWLGRAEELFAKDEYRRELIFTLIESSYGFERAGLLWAARSKLMAAIERSFHALLVSGELPHVVNHCLKRLMWVEVQLGRIPHVLQANSWWHFCAGHFGASKPLDVNEVRLLDAVLGIHFLNFPVDRLGEVRGLPDPLSKLGLGMARLAVLYALGHEEQIQLDAFSDDPQGPVDLLKFFEQWHDQPAREDLPAQPMLSDSPVMELRSMILGSEIVVSGPNEPTAIGIAESLLGALEALLATSDERDVLAHTELTQIRVRKVEGLSAAPTFEWLSDTPGVHAEIGIGERVEFADQEALKAFAEFLVETSLKIACRQFTIRDPDSWIRKVAGEERGLSRAALFGNVLVLGRNVFGSDPKVKLQDWISEDDSLWEVKRDVHWRPKSLPGANGKLAQSLKFGSAPQPDDLMDTSQRKHSERRVVSPIDVSTWNAAGWGGACYGSDFMRPPIMSLMFRDLDAGARIFSNWRTRWGVQGVEDALRVAIVTGVSKRNPHHYAVVVGPNIGRLSRDLRPGVIVSTVSRILHMTPDSPENLNTFLREYGKFRAFFLVPGRLPSGQTQTPEILYELALVKRSVDVRPAWEIGENDFDMVALLDDEDPMIPDGVVDAPVLKAMALRRDRRSRR